MPLLGAHVDSSDPLPHAESVGAEAVQFFLSDPQGWKKPEPHPHADAIRASDLRVYIHAPYLVNVASTNNKIRIPSRKILSQHADAAAEIGAPLSTRRGETGASVSDISGQVMCGLCKIVTLP